MQISAQPFRIRGIGRNNTLLLPKLLLRFFHVALKQLSSGLTLFLLAALFIFPLALEHLSENSQENF
jgi:hypothetical protein